MKKILSLSILVTLLSQSVFAINLFDHSLREDFDHERSLFWMPFVSLLLPSFDQWYEEQYPAALTYAGMAGAGYLLAFSTYEEVNGVNEPPEIDGLKSIDEWGDRERKFVLGNQIAQVAGSLSAYHSFRTAARSHGSKYSFLPEEEDSGDILLAPFRFEFLTRPTTFIPLGVFLALVAAGVSDSSNPRGEFNSGDAAFVSGISYGAGTGEEALFRGWLMPMFYEKMGSRFWSNSASAVIFGAAHLSSENRFPIAQTIAGWYFGMVAQRNNWSIQESVFIHAWWDVIAFAAYFMDGSNLKKTDTDSYMPGPQFYFTF